MLWTSEALEAILVERGWYDRSSEDNLKEIAYGRAYRLIDGTTVNWYRTGRVLVQGKPSTIKTAAQGLFAAQPQPPKAAAATTAATGSRGDTRHVDVFTDGACLGNPGPGGYGVILDHQGRRKELSGGFRLTTNNRMEMLAAILGLESLTEACVVTISSDSQYLVQAVKLGWAKRWQANGWRRSNGEPAVNADLWARFLSQYQKHKVSMVWVRGHNGHRENERCDYLATTAARGVDLLIDEEYERLHGDRAAQTPHRR